MPIIKWKPFRDIEEFFEDFPFSHTWDLAADVYEDDKNIIVEMHVPGIDPDKIDIQIENNHLVISGKRSEESTVTNKDYYKKEIRRGSFERVIALPASVAVEQATADIKDGVLRVSLPKSTESKESKKIKVSRK